MIEITLKKWKVNEDGNRSCGNAKRSPKEIDLPPTFSILITQKIMGKLSFIYLILELWYPVCLEWTRGHFHGFSVFTKQNSLHLAPETRSEKGRKKLILLTLLNLQMDPHPDLYYLVCWKWLFLFNICESWTENMYTSTKLFSLSAK